MNPQDDISKVQGQTEVVKLQEQFGDGLQDRSLPAAQILVEQKEARDSTERVFALRSMRPRCSSLTFHPP